MKKPRKKRSPIWLMPESDFRELIAKSMTIGDVLGFFGFSRAGNNWHTVARRCKEQGIDASHFDSRGRQLAAIRQTALPLEEVLCKDSSYSRSSLKKRLLDEGLLVNKCAICDIPPFWNGMPLVLRIDHENGDPRDHRIENLRLICHNCDSQLITYCISNHGRTRNRRNCPDCGKVLSSKKSERCQRCANRLQNRERFKWPEDQELLAMVRESNNSVTAKKLGVAETAVRKKLKRIAAGKQFDRESSNVKTGAFGVSNVG